MRIFDLGNGKFAHGQVLIDPDTGDPYKASSGTSGSSSDRELVVTTYVVKTAFTGASDGDTVTATQIIDVSGDAPTTMATIWRNQTAAADLASPPAANTLDVIGKTPLTYTQLAAAGLALDGTDGATPPTNPGTGIRGWLRGIYEKLTGALTVSGVTAVGSAPTGIPVSVAGVDGAGIKRHVLVGSNGSLFVTVASDGVAFDPDNYAQTYSYNADGTLNYIAVTVSGKTYRQTMTYTSGVLTGVSNWVKQ